MPDETTRPSILIVDDVPGNLDVLKNALEDEYIVRAALNGPLALRLAVMEPRPNLILLDIVMPGMDGYEVCRQLKEDHRTQGIPVIFVTAKSHGKDELEGLQVGAVDYITKPISPLIVKARVRLHLALEEKNRRLFEINGHLTDSMEQLSASEERFRSLVQTIPDIVYKIDEKGHFTFLNKSIERLGYHQADLIGKHFSEIIHSEDLNEVSLERVLERIGNGAPNPEQKLFNERRSGVRMTVGMEIRMKIKNGQSNRVYEIRNIGQDIISVEVNSTGLYGENRKETSRSDRQYVGTVGVIRDITDRLKVQDAFMEERKLLRQLIDAVPLPIFFFESQGKLIFSNDAFQKFTGMDGNNLDGIDLNELFCLDDQPKIDAMVSHLLENPEEDRIHQKIELKSHDDQIHPIDVILLKFQKSDQATPDVIGVLVDFTEQMAFTTRLIQAKKYAEEMAGKATLASHAKGEFLAKMSHEIRTPLNGVIGLTHLCLQTELTGQQRDYLVKVSVSANTLLQLINDILDFSKIEAGKLIMEVVEFTLDEVLGGVVAALSIKSHEKGLELLLDTKRNIPLCLQGDPHRLGQILTNLVGNAIKFTEKGEVSITIEVMEETEVSALLQFTVRDTGIGMTPEQVSNLFQEFSQGDSSITRKYGGTGLGLAISKRLVEMMEGRIEVANEPGRGSRFTFTARFNKVEAPVMEIPMPPDNLRGMHILVVDDNEGARQIIAEHLKSLSYHPVCVADGEAAIEAIVAADGENAGFDLVLMDWRMPGMSGMEAVRHIKKTLSLQKTPNIIMVTAYGLEYIESSEEEKSLLDGFLMKPVNITSLLDVIMIVFGHEATRQLVSRSNSPFAHLAGAKVLLAEDNEINQQVAQELLEQAGIEVVIANNGQEAVALAIRDHFDAILMDLQMPIMDGLTATKRIRREKSADMLPIIAMTANTMNGDREKCLNKGMNDHIAKPVNPEMMYETLARWLPSRPDLPLQPPVLSHPGRVKGLVLPIPPLPGIDLAKGMGNMGNNATLYRKVLLKFARNQGGACLEMDRCLASRNFTTLEHIAHALKGVSATLGILKLADLAGRIEKQSMNPEGLKELPELLVKISKELAHIVSTIETTLVQETSIATREEQSGADVSSEELAPLFRKAVLLLADFDSSAEKMVEEIEHLARSGVRRKRMESIKAALGAYDFEICLLLFRAWAKEEGIYLEDNQP